MAKPSTCLLAVIGLLLPLLALAQSDSDEAPLGDVARSVRSQNLPAQHATTVIDNENLSEVMADSQKLKAESTPVFSIEPGGQNFKMNSPDGECSLSFSANATALISDPLLARDVPRSELAKIDGPASIQSDSLEISVYNGSAYNLTEITVGLTIVRHDNPEQQDTASIASGKLINAAMRSGERAPADAPSTQPMVKRSDSTLLYHLKGSAAPLKTTVFREIMASAIEPDEEWHWAIVEAKGYLPKPVSQLPIRKLPMLPANSIQPAGPAEPMAAPTAN